MEKLYLSAHLERYERDFMRKGHKGWKNTGYYPQQPYKFLNALEEIAKQYQEPQRFLDLGSGLGLPVVAAASQGIDSTGIEINSLLFEGSKGLITLSYENQMIPPTTQCIVRNKSYYPSDYIHRRENGLGIAGAYENNEERGKDVFFPEASDIEPTYLQSFDCIFAYCWPVQIPSILEMFNLYAAHDAILMMDSPGKPNRYNTLLKDLELQWKTDTFDILMKQR
ncbi:MAG: hypothetical protein ACQESG_00930 [Nanobdellota archaeon]